MRRKTFICLLLLSALTARAQLHFDSGGNLLMGGAAAPSGAQNNWYVNGYKGLRWVWYASGTSTPTRFFQIDLTKSSPCIFGGNTTASTGEVDFCLDVVYWNTLMVRRTYTNVTGTVQSFSPNTLSHISTLRLLLDGSLALPTSLSQLATRRTLENGAEDITVDYAGTLSLLTDAAQQLQGKIIRQQAALNALPVTASASASAMNASEVLAHGTKSVRFAASADGNDSFATLSTLDGRIVRKQMKADAGGNLDVDTDGLEAGTYVCALFVAGKIVQTKYIVVTR